MPLKYNIQKVNWQKKVIVKNAPGSRPKKKEYDEVIEFLKAPSMFLPNNFTDQYF